MIWCTWCSRCVHISDIGVGYISTMLALSSLFLRWCSQIRDFGLQHICGMRNLHILSVAGTYHHNIAFLFKYFNMCFKKKSDPICKSFSCLIPSFWQKHFPYLQDVHNWHQVGSQTSFNFANLRSLSWPTAQEALQSWWDISQII